MLKQFLLFSLFILLPLAIFAQEDACKESGDYWSEDLLTCYSKDAMDADENFVFNEINKLQAQKDRLQHEQQEYNASNQAIRDGAFAARIASLEAKRDTSAEQVVKDTYQEEIDTQTNRRDFHANVNVSGHGALISDLSNKISKLSEELDIILQQ